MWYIINLQLKLEADDGPELGVDAGCPLEGADVEVDLLLVKPISDALGIPT